MHHMPTNCNQQRASDNRSITLRLLAVFGLLLMIAGPVWSLTGAEIQKLHRAGIRGDLLQTIIRERTVETRALTVDELIALKQSGLSDSQITGLAIEKSFIRNREPVHYGDNTRGVKSLRIQDIERLKAKGISDEIIRDLIVASTRNANEDERQRAWRMLDNMRLYVY